MTRSYVDRCPACNSGNRVLLHADVPDFVFHATDERWNITRCNECRSVYLLERPSEAVIGEYYKNYQQVT